MTKLSVAAQAVLDAVEDDCIHPSDKHRLAAAALRAAAEPFHWTWSAEMCHKHISAIAAELEAQ